LSFSKDGGTINDARDRMQDARGRLAVSGMDLNILETEKKCA
jgi:hypothetical protein